jgi:hypothetical protein
MKRSQWIGALAVLVLMVFVITYALVFLDPGGEGDGKAPEKGQPPPQLTFEERFHPTPAGPKEFVKPIAQEARDTRHNFDDFWYENTNDTAVTVGLADSNCGRCLEVTLFVLPAADKERTAWLRAWYAAGTEEAERRLKELEARAQSVVLEKGGAGAEVPAGAVGWARLRWSTAETSPAPQGRQAKLWFGSPAHPMFALEALVHVREPLRAAGDQVRKLGPGGQLRPEDLPFREQDIVCWSTTRRELRLTASVLGPARVAPDSDPFTVGAQQVLPADGYARFADQVREWPVLVAYRVPITLARVSADGKRPIDYGPFRRFVLLSLEGEKAAEAVRLCFECRIAGPLEVGGPGEDGSVRFSDFARSKGATRSVVVRTERPGLELTVDTTRTSEFLEAKLPPKPEVAEDGSRTWVLQVTVKPGAVRGRFPDPNDPRARDSAVYLRIAGDERAHRVPVSGNAQDG